MANWIDGHRAWWILGAIALIAALAGLFTVPPIDRDEARFAQATAQMLETGNFVEISFQDTPRHKKPVGIHWMQAVTVGLFSSEEARDIWAYRLPSLAGFLLTVLAGFWAASKVVKRETAFVAACLLAIGPLIGFESGIAKTDSMLVGLTTLALAAIIHIRTGGGRRAGLVFWVAVGLGVLIKGPVTPMVAGLTLLGLAVWERRIAWMRPLAFWPGPLLALLIVVPWLVSIQLATDGAFLREALGEDLGPKIISGHESHGGLPGYHLLALPLLSFPMIFFLIPGGVLVYRALTSGETVEKERARLLLAWLVPTWLVFELLPTKLPHYVLPVYPALAIIAALGWERMRETPRWSRFLALGLGGLAALVLGLLLYIVPSEFGGLAFTGILAAMAFIILVAGVMVEIVRHRLASALMLAVIAGLSWQISLRGLLIPSAADINLSPRVAERLADMIDNDAYSNAPLYSTFTEPSLVFLAGTQTHLVNEEELAEAVNGRTEPFITVQDTSRSGDDLELMDTLERTACQREEVAGLNYARGDETVLIIRLHNCPEGISE